MRAAIAATMLILALGCEHQASVPPVRAPGPAPAVAPSASAEVVSEPSAADPVEAVFAAAATMVDAAKGCTDTWRRERSLPWLRPEADDQRWFERRARPVLAGLAEAGTPSKAVSACSPTRSWR